MREGDQALFNTDAVLEVDRALIERLKSSARTSTTGRYRLCLHESPDEQVQEMVVVHCRENYSRPHRHPSTASSMLVIEGRCTVFVFDEAGAVTRKVELAPRTDGGPFIVRLAANVWHMPVCRSEQLVFYETMEGPFDRDAMNDWAPWSPPEDDEQAIARYLLEVGAR